MNDLSCDDVQSPPATLKEQVPSNMFFVCLLESNGKFVERICHKLMVAMMILICRDGERQPYDHRQPQSNYRCHRGGGHHRRRHYCDDDDDDGGGGGDDDDDNGGATVAGDVAIHDFEGEYILIGTVSE
mmetsp:Transcript_12954/g.18087  ORF Transcript_12954/g.18087 Transcript_12954/m.18087 type:complete len:129 (-) Transcript_12954:28-414(-)